MNGVTRIGFLQMLEPPRIRARTTNLIQGKAFAKIDKNADGQVGGGELCAFLSKAHFNHKATNVIEDRDMNGDAVLDADESGISEERFARIDKNEDGYIDRGELTPLLPKAYLNRMTTTFIENEDTNGDALLNPNELDVSEETFARIDQDEDGQVGGRELNAFLPKAYLNRKTAAWIENRDINGDGILDSSEFRVSPAMFARMDTNENGRIDRGEFGAALTRIHYTA